ncbi:hypothetical protein ACHAWF_001201 [Thalassiosira exigua]
MVAMVLDGAMPPGKNAIARYIILLVAICLICCIDADDDDEGMSDSEFEEVVSKARTKQRKTDIGYYPLRDFETYQGDFSIKYMDRDKELSGTTRIELKNNGSNGYTIKGSCKDADGVSTITEGFSSYSGDAWWVEETSEGKDKGLKVLIEGLFDFHSNQLTGTWRANTGVSGKYTEFKAEDVSETFTPAGEAAAGAMEASPQTLQQMLEEDIPSAVASPLDTPLLSDSKL